MIRAVGTTEGYKDFYKELDQALSGRNCQIIEQECGRLSLNIKAVDALRTLVEKVPIGIPFEIAEIRALEEEWTARASQVRWETTSLERVSEFDFVNTFIRCLIDKTIAVFYLKLRYLQILYFANTLQHDLQWKVDVDGSATAVGIEETTKMWSNRASETRDEVARLKLDHLLPSLDRVKDQLRRQEQVFNHRFHKQQKEVRARAEVLGIDPREGYEGFVQELALKIGER